MSVLTQTLDATSIFAEEAAAAMCLLSMKMNPSSPESLAAASDYHLTQHPPPPHNTNQLLPMSLSTSHDYDVLSPLQCYIRQNCIEFFAADDNGSGYVAKGRQTQITLGRVGIRCVYCKHATERATQSASFPKQIDKIYSAASMIQCRHFPSCVHIPKAVKDELARLKKQGNGSVKMQKVSGNEDVRRDRPIFLHTHTNVHSLLIIPFQYWAEGARELGFVDTDHDIRFIPTVSPMEDVEYTTSNTVALYGGGNTMNDTKFHSFATPARPRIVTPFPTENNLAPSGAVFMGEGRVAPFLEGIDMGLVQDHVFMAFAQMETIILTRTDKVGPWKDKICGTKGLRCRHCQGRCLIKGKSQGKWFPSSAKNLGQTTTMNSIVK